MSKFLNNKWTHILILLLLLGGAVSFSGSNNDLRKRLQYLVFDSYNKLHPREATDEVVIIDIDEASLRKVGQWPWSRDVVAKLVTNLKSYGAKSITFDMVFAEEDRTSPHNISKKLPDTKEYEEAKKLIQILPDNNDIFSESIQNAGNVVTGFTKAKEDETRQLPFQPVSPTFLLKQEHKQSLIKNSYSRDGVATNLPIISKNAAGNGHFMVEPETDGIIRRVPLFARYKPSREIKESSNLYPLLSMEALRVSINPKSQMVIRQNREKKNFDLNYEVIMGKHIIPLDDNSKFWVYYRDISLDEYVSAHAVLDLNPAIKPRIKDKIVFIGTSAEGLRDIRSTPLEQYIAGVEVHVNVVEQILQKKYLKRSKSIVDTEDMFMFFVGFSIILLTPIVSLASLGFITVTLTAFVFSGSWYAYVHKGLLLDPVYPSIVLFLLFVGASLLNYLRSETDRRQVKTAFGHYISPVFMEELTKNPDKLKLGGEVRELTVMFTDIRGFTGISESLSPEELIQLMNDFLTPMSNLVMESRGTIDKYMGDAMMAFWNAPLDDADHAYQACITALRMNEALMPINQKLKEKALAEGKKEISLSAGIGINTGSCAVGNMGSKQRFAYSALGDSVNLASRLEGQTKVYGVETLIGEDTYKLVPNLAFLELDLIQVKGREEAIKIYTLIGDEGVTESDSFKKWKSAHNSMLAAYRIADWSCAAQDCKEAAEFSEGKLKIYYEMYKKRIIKYTKNPPPDNWGGVYIAKNK